LREGKEEDNEPEKEEGEKPAIRRVLQRNAKVSLY